VRDRKGEVVAVVCIDLSLNDLKNLSDYLQVYPNSHYTIRSSTGMEIVPLPDTVPGRKYNIYTEEIDATGWHIEIIIPEEELFRELNHTGRVVGLLMLLGLGVLIFIVWHANRSNRRLIESLEKNQRMESELQIASTIQTAMLPKVFPPFVDRPDVNLYGMVHPAKEIGGDLYDFYVRHEKLFFCVGDVSGKGVPAALVMATTRSLFRSITAHDEAPEVIMRKMNRAFVDQNTQEMFLTLFLGVLDCKTGKLAYCNAGHNAPVRIQNTDRSADRIQMLEVVPNLPLGIEPEFEFLAQHTQLHYNDVLFIYTDGLTEAENSLHEQFGEQRMMDTLASEQLRANGYNPLELVHTMRKNVAAFVDGAEQSDDLTMMAIRYQIPALLMANDIGQIPTLPEWIDALDVPMDVNMQVNLALEEAVSNVMLYAYPNISGSIQAECVKNEGQLIFSITDSGVPFDPTRQKEVDTTLNAEERSIGGLGIHLVKQIMNEVRYARIDDKNVLTLVKNL
jgi:sigma-B regulation protein RsbU (phosphoserine phosphatase)